MSLRRHIILLENGNDVLTSQKIFVIENDTFTIGRSTSNDIVVKNDYLSRTHAMLVINHEGKYELIDGSYHCRSRNGNFINGEQISRQVLINGDLLEFGRLMRGIYLSQVLSEVELFSYLVKISQVSDFNHAAIEAIKSAEPMDKSRDCTLVTRLR